MKTKFSFGNSLQKGVSIFQLLYEQKQMLRTSQKSTSNLKVKTLSSEHYFICFTNFSVYSSVSKQRNEKIFFKKLISSEEI